jgi:hypothetical protein
METQSYWTTTKLWKLTVVLDYYEDMETYSRIGLLRSYGNLQSYWTRSKSNDLQVDVDRLKREWNDMKEEYFKKRKKKIHEDAIFEAKKKVNYTRNEWGRCKTTLEKRGEDVPG